MIKEKHVGPIAGFPGREPLAYEIDMARAVMPPLTPEEARRISNEISNEFLEKVRTGKLDSKGQEYRMAPALLKQAATEMENRAIQRDTPGGERSMERAVEAFNSLSKTKLTSEDGWLFMVCLKLARSVNGKFREDDYVDAAAYCALLGEEVGKNAVSNSQ